MKKSEYFRDYFAGQHDTPVVLVSDTCLEKAADDEPIFVLRAHDPIAADIVEIWATLASRHHEFEKCERAKKCAYDMRVWLLDYLQAKLDE